MLQTGRDNSEIMRDEMIMRDKIRDLLADGAKTIPELAAALDAPSHEVLLWVMGMRRYGALEEVGRPNDNGYFQYALAGEEKE